MNEKESELLSISEAKLWLEAKHPGGLIMKSGDKSQKKYYLTKKWSEAKKFENDKVDVVEIPLGAEEMIGFITAETEELVRNTGIIEYASSETRLVIQKFKKTGLVTAHFMTITGDPEYLEITDFKVDKNSMLKKEKDFSGIVLFHELNGLFNVGWKYSDGKLTHKITSDKVVQSGLRLKVASVQCYRIDMYEIIYYYIEYDSGASRLDRVETTWLGSYTWRVDGTGIDGGGSGGAGSPETSELSCSCNICPVCGGCLPELILKKAVIPDDDGTSGTTTTTNETETPCPMCSCPPQTSIPDLESLSSNFSIVANMTSEQVYNLIGGNVLYNRINFPNDFQNACALRLSYTLNMILGEEIPFIMNQTLSGDVNNDGINEWYFFKVTDMVDYLNRIYGNCFETNTDNIKGMTGLIWQRDCDWGDASGHLDVWNGNNALDHYYEECNDIYIWRN